LVSHKSRKCAGEIRASLQNKSTFWAAFRADEVTRPSFVQQFLLDFLATDDVPLFLKVDSVDVAKTDYDAPVGVPHPLAGVYQQRIIILLDTVPESKINSCIISVLLYFRSGDVKSPVMYGAMNFSPPLSSLYFPFRSARARANKLPPAPLCSSPFPPRRADPFRTRLSLSARCVSLLACCTRSRAISPGLTRGGTRELQLQLHARWGYAGLGRVRCTSRPSVCPRPTSSLLPSSVTSLLPASPALSTFFVYPSFFLLLLFLLLFLRVLSPHPRARRRLLPLSKSPAETRYTQAAASTWTHVVAVHPYACRTSLCARVCMRVSVSPRVSCPPFEKK